jgi:hypothetical protein
MLDTPLIPHSITRSPTSRVNENRFTALQASWATLESITNWGFLSEIRPNTVYETTCNEAIPVNISHQLLSVTLSSPLDTNATVMPAVVHAIKMPVAELANTLDLIWGSMR